jgi:hypothetical protein
MTEQKKRAKLDKVLEAYFAASEMLGRVEHQLATEADIHARLKIARTAKALEDEQSRLISQMHEISNSTDFWPLFDSWLRMLLRAAR